MLDGEEVGGSAVRSGRRAAGNKGGGDMMYALLMYALLPQRRYINCSQLQSLIYSSLHACATHLQQRRDGHDAQRGHGSGVQDLRQHASLDVGSAGGLPAVTAWWESPTLQSKSW